VTAINIAGAGSAGLGLLGYTAHNKADRGKNHMDMKGSRTTSKSIYRPSNVGSSAGVPIVFRLVLFSTLGQSLPLSEER